MPPIEFSKWMREVATDWVYRRGTGRRNAWEYGAQAALGGRDYGNIYHRADCRRAEKEGRLAAEDAIRQGLVILCGCCGQPFSRAKG